MKSVLKFLLRLPFIILQSLEFLYERLLAKVTSTAFSSSGRSAYIKRNANRVQSATHINKDGKEFKASFYIPNTLCQFRIDTFSEKEPEMLDWVDTYGDDGAFFDIGANIGLYSIYFAKTKAGNVYSFEPSVFNVAQLAKNISINGLSNKICLVPNPLSNENGKARFILSSSDEGGAMNAFGVNYGHDGNELNSEIEFDLLGLSLDSLISTGLIGEVPKLIKIDVDGIEHLILKGAIETLSNEICKSVFVEVDDKFVLQAEEVEKILTDCGFKLQEKIHSELVASGQDKFSSIYNQIWVKE